MDEAEVLYADEASSFSIRSYQEQLLNQAMQENVIIYLPTGSGKTFIALMAIKRMSKDLEGTLQQGAKRTCFLTNTVVLAKQQFEIIKNFVNCKVRLYTGDMNVDNWKRDKWEIELNKYEVFVSTCQIILDIVRHNYISINDFNLLIFDECHHATKGHPMLQLMNQFSDAKQDCLPRVIGLTGSLLKATSDNIIEDLNNLEAVFRSKITTVLDLDEYKNVFLYSTNPSELVVIYNDVQNHFQIKSIIENLINECIDKFTKFKIDQKRFISTKNLSDLRLINPIKKMENLLKDFLYQLDDFGPYGGIIAILSIIVEVELKQRQAETIIYKNMCKTIVTCAEHILHLLKNHIYDLDDLEQTELDVIYNSSSDKVKTLLRFLKKSFNGKAINDIKCLIFVDRRHTAKNLFHIINNFTQHDSSLPIKANFMVGVNNRLPHSIENILDTKYDRSLLTQFKSNECNLIVASNVLEEGIDVQSCNYVIIYDELKSFTSYIQTMGRARMVDSCYTLLMGKSRQSRLLANIKKYKDIDKTMKNFLMSKTIDRKLPLKSDFDKPFESLIQPFYSKIGAKLEAESVVAICNRYCAGLPNDTYTQTLPQYSKVETLEGVDGKIVKLTLPLQSSIKEDIISDPMPSIKWAKRSAAFKACKLLYENGELNQHMLPITKKNCFEMVKSLYFKEWEKYPNDKKYSAGTKKNRRSHNVLYPKELCCTSPVLGQISYLYTIKIVPKFEKDSTNYHVFDSLTNPSNFALLLKKELPKIAPMPLFTTQGGVIAYISQIGHEIILCNSDDYKKLRNFNTMIFKDLISDIWAGFYAQDHRNAENSFIIVPTTSESNNAVRIDWDLVENFQFLSEVKKIPDVHRSTMPIQPEKYLNKLVATWYTADDSVRYIVTKIRDDLTPLSPFPKADHETFASYVNEKWNQNVFRTDSFLIQVEPFTTRINFLTYNEEKKKTKRFEEILMIPELVHNFEFPAHYYLKARILPSILYRLNYLLFAEELRVSFNNYLNIKIEDYDPLPLVVDKTLKRVNSNIIKTRESFNLYDEENLIKNIQPINQNRYQIYNWKDYEEPFDLSRKMQDLYEIDIDYYNYFITEMEKLKISNENEEQFSIINAGIAKINVNRKEQLMPDTLSSKDAICDVNLDERRGIRILYIDNFSQSQIRGPEQWELLSAITTAEANDVFDSERLEMLGDSFLKFSVSLWLLHEHVTWNEGFLTEIKGKLVSNRHLLYCSMKSNLPGLIYAKSFKPKQEWKPPSINVPQNAIELVCQKKLSTSVFTELELTDEEIISGECSQSTLTEFASKFSNFLLDPLENDMTFLLNQTWISDKVCADAVEALIGVCVKNYGIRKSFLLLEYFHIVPKKVGLENLLDINLGNPRLRTDITDKEVDVLLLNYSMLERNLGYKFKDRAYLLQALTHPSYPTNRITGCYQQLEFIGDAILDFLITSFIFENCTDMDPGKLTDLRSALVNNVTLACLSIRHKFHLFLLSQNAALSQSIIKFVEFQEQNNYRITDQVRMLPLENEFKAQVADYINVPKALGDIFESIIGAIFLDSGNDLKTVWNVIYNLMSLEIYEFMSNVPIQVVRQLYEYHGANPVFDDPFIDHDIVSLACTFTCRNSRVQVYGFGKNHKEAKISAAKAALQHLSKA